LIAAGSGHVTFDFESKYVANQCYNPNVMTKEIEAVYEQGLIRPLEALDLPDGTRLDVIVITHDQPSASSKAFEMISEIAALPLEDSTDAFSGREHDSILYPKIVK
jgi:predicted DNA-binding antitoxin AbrB/MazE fold protein